MINDTSKVSVQYLSDKKFFVCFDSDQLSFSLTNLPVV